MRNRQEQNPRWRGEAAFPEYEDYGLHAEDRQQYRGRESYEQQSRSGMGGRSGAFNQRFLPREYDERYRNNADEDQRGYQNLGYRQEFESGGRGGGGRYERDSDDARYGFDSRDYGRPRGERWEGQGQDYRRDDYSRTDYGQRGYGQRDLGSRDYQRDFGSRDYQRDYDQQRDFGSRDYQQRDFGSRDYQQRDFGSRDSRDYQRDFGARDAWQREYGSPYSRRSSYEDPYDSPRQRSGYDLGGRGFGWRSSGNWPEQGFEQQRYGQGQGQGQGEVGSSRRQMRGPKGYRRSDERIREDVCDRLSQSWDLDSSEVEVTVSSGEVTLTGTINDRDQKFRAESIADAVGGVSEVHNQLRVRRESTAQTTSPQAVQPTKPSATNPSRSS